MDEGLPLDETTLRQIDDAVRTLRAGGLVAIPTETVYGLAADATNADAVHRIFALKGRPASNPLIVHVASAAAAERYVAAFPEEARRLAGRFWPGPLTLVLPKATSIPPIVTAGRDTVALRVPDHPLTLELLQRFDGPLAAPSANQSSHVSPTTAQHVRDEFGERCPTVLDGGPCRVGIESSVLDLCSRPWRILRPGAVTQPMLEAVVGRIEAARLLHVGPHGASSPGQLPVHYAPRTPAFHFDPSQRPRVVGSHVAIIDLPPDPRSFEQSLYARLRSLDAQHLRAIYVELPPEAPEWSAARDRVLRATRPIAGAHAGG